MKIIEIFILVSFVLFNLFIQDKAGAESKTLYNFDEVQSGSLPEGWRIDATNAKGAVPRWEVVTDLEAPSAPKVLSITEINDSYDGVFNLFWNPGIPFQNGTLQVNIRANSGKEDQGGGVIWRAKDSNNYYIVRYNPLERNFRLYSVKNGRRKLIGDAREKIRPGEWFTIKISHNQNTIVCWLNGKELFRVEDSTFSEPGGIGFWTKADAASSFDDLIVEVKD